MGFTCYCINLRIIASFLRLTMGSHDAKIMKYDFMIDQFEEEKIV